MKTIYLDVTNLSGDGFSIGIIIPNTDAEVRVAGTTILKATMQEKAELEQRYAAYDLHFIFDDTVSVPEPDFFPVPMINIVAQDSVGGLICSVGQTFDLELPVYYISQQQKCFLIAESGKEFLAGAASWQQQLQPSAGLTLYPSKAAAEQELELFELPNHFHIDT